MANIINIRIGAFLVAVLAALLAIALLHAPPGQALAAKAGTQADRVPSMTAPKAKFVLTRALKKNYKGTYIFGENKRITNCKRLSRVRVTCKISWTKGHYWYHGPGAVYYRANGTVWYKYNLDRDRF